MRHPFLLSLTCLTALLASETNAKADAPAPYSIPWQLRPAAAASAFRVDNSIAFLSALPNATATDKASGTTLVSMFSGSYGFSKEFALAARIGVIDDSPPGSSAQMGISNLLVGGTYVLPLTSELRLAGFFGTTLPVGNGGGNTPNAAKAKAQKSAVLARAAMDNALFATNDIGFVPGIDLAYVSGGFTLQAEATVIQLFRVRGADAQPDSARTNFTSGLHAGYYILPQLSFGAELRHQRFLSTPAAVGKDTTGTLRDTTTVAFGPRGHFDLDFAKFKPGLSFTFGLDNPLQASSYKIVQLDLLFVL